MQISDQKQERNLEAINHVCNFVGKLSVKCNLNEIELLFVWQRLFC